MVICHDNRELELSVGDVSGLGFGSLLSHPHSGLGNAVEVDIILTDELVNGRILAAPVVFPLVTAPALIFEVGLSERDRRPERLRPYPDSQTLNAVHNRSGNSPLDVSGETEGNESFACSVADTVICEDSAGFVAVGELLELYRERRLFWLFEVFMCGH